MNINTLKNKTILILGFGKEGRDTLCFLRKAFPNKTLGIADRLELEKLDKKVKKTIKSTKNIELYFGKSYFDAIPQYDIVFRTPGIPLQSVQKYTNAKQKITSQTDFFLQQRRKKTIGITGTKGKGTTASLVFGMLKQNKLPVDLIGNIGKPVLSYLNSTVKKNTYVFELSAQQLQGLKISPHIAVFLNLYRAHLDYFQNLKDYKKAKTNILLYQEKFDWFVYNSDQKFLKDLSQKTKAQKVSIGLKNQKSDCWTNKKSIFWQKEKIVDISKIQIQGNFNLYNIMSAIAVAKILNIPSSAIENTIKRFRPLPHRLELIGKFKGITFYNDSLATIPESAIFAINTFEPKLHTLIVGGYDAKQEFKYLAKKILESKIRNLILFPPVGKRIKDNIILIAKKEDKFKKRLKQIKFFVADSMEQAVIYTFKNTVEGKICLLSPAAPSFGIFKDYKERGELFKQNIKKYG